MIPIARTLGAASVLAATAWTQHTVTLQPEECAVGAEVRVHCDVEHTADGLAHAIEPRLDPADPWVFLDAEATPGDDGTRLTWTLLGLDPGAPTPPDLYYTLRASADAEGRTVRVVPPDVRLVGELAQDEDAPRPLIGLREFPEALVADEEGASPLLFASVGGVLVALLLGALWMRARRARAHSARKADRNHAAELVALAGSSIGPRAKHFAMTALVRRALDERTGHSRRGWTDDEIVAALERDEDLLARLGPEACGAAAEALRRAADPKYAGARPTDFAVDETLAHAERALTLMEARP